MEGTYAVKQPTPNDYHGAAGQATEPIVNGALNRIESTQKELIYLHETIEKLQSRIEPILLTMDRPAGMPHDDKSAPSPICRSIEDIQNGVFAARQRLSILIERIDL